MESPVKKTLRRQQSNADTLLDILIRYEPPKCKLSNHLEHSLNLICTDKRCQEYFNLICVKCQKDNIHQQENHQSSKLKDILIFFCQETQKQEELQLKQTQQQILQEIPKHQLEKTNKVLSDLQGIKQQIDLIISHIETLKQTCILSSISFVDRAEEIMGQMINQEQTKELLENKLKQVFQIAEFTNGKLIFRDKQSLKNVSEELEWKVENLKFKIDIFNQELHLIGYLNKNEPKQSIFAAQQPISRENKSQMRLKTNNSSEDDSPSNQKDHTIQMKQNWIKKGYKNGTYYGEVRSDFYDGKQNLTRHGMGIFIYKDNDRYEGYFENGERTGHGVYLYVNGNKYEGSFLDGKFHGKGKYYNNWNGNLYEGDFMNGKFHGEGKYTYKNGECYQGQFFEGKSIKLEQILQKQSPKKKQK